MSFTTVLFDLDGTLSDPYEGIIGGIQYALESVALHEDDPEKLRRYIGPPLRQTFALYGFDPEACEKLVDKYRELYLVSGIHQNVPYPGIESVLKALFEHGVKIVLASCKPEDACRQILDEHGFLPYFTDVVGATLDKTLDTKPAIIGAALSRLGITGDGLSQTLMVGDRDMDILGGHENHIQAAGTLYGYGTRDELSSVGADFLVEKPEDLLKIVFS